MAGHELHLQFYNTQGMFLQVQADIQAQQWCDHYSLIQQSVHFNKKCAHLNYWLNIAALQVALKQCKQELIVQKPQVEDN